MTRTMEKMKETCHGAPSTPPSDPHPREGEGQGDEGKGGCCHHRRRWWDRANGSCAVMAINGGGGNGFFTAVLDDGKVVAVVTITSLVDGGGGDGHRLCRNSCMCSIVASFQHHVVCWGY